MTLNRFLEIIKPGVNKRSLLFIAALIWTFAGSMLFYRGIGFLKESGTNIWLKAGISVVAGTVFYLGMFSKISGKHVKRILNMTQNKPCAFSFFNFRSYLIMIIMISLGIFSRKSGLVPVDYLAILYVTMGIPLFASSFRFYYYGIKYKTFANK